MLPERPFLAIVVHSHTQETGIVYRNKTSVRGRNRLCRDMLGPLPVRIGHIAHAVKNIAGRIPFFIKIINIDVDRIMRTALYGGLPCQLLHLHGRAEHCADDCSAYFIGQTQLACSIATVVAQQCLLVGRTPSNGHHGVVCRLRGCYIGRRIVRISHFYITGSNIPAQI